MLRQIDAHDFCSLAANGTQFWYVIHCKTRKEKFATEILKDHLGLNVYLPEKKTWNNGIAQYIPLFPGYFFIRADLQKIAPSQISTSPGVLRILDYDGEPQPIPPFLVEMIYKEVTLFNEYMCTPDQRFQPGDTLNMTTGPLRGLETIFIGPTTPSKRVQVFLNFLGRLTKAEVEASTLEKRPESCKPRRIRYTRGKGRKIGSVAPIFEQGMTG